MQTHRDPPERARRGFDAAVAERINLESSGTAMLVNRFDGTREAGPSSSAWDILVADLNVSTLNLSVCLSLGPSARAILIAHVPHVHLS